MILVERLVPATVLFLKLLSSVCVLSIGSMAWLNTVLNSVRMVASTLTVLRWRHCRRVRVRAVNQDAARSCLATVPCARVCRPVGHRSCATAISKIDPETGWVFANCHGKLPINGVMWEQLSLVTAQLQNLRGMLRLLVWALERCATPALTASD